nr:ribonuclease H-like domain-containing protein [Tanacetum cinerariifolium]
VCLHIRMRIGIVSILLVARLQAEYRGVANAVAETCWLRNLLRELHTPLFFATLVYYENVSVVYLSCNLVQHQRTKHIEIDIHFARDLVSDGQVRVLHVPLRYQFADIFTKGLPSALFKEFHSSLSLLYDLHEENKALKRMNKMSGIMKDSSKRLPNNSYNQMVKDLKDDLTFVKSKLKVYDRLLLAVFVYVMFLSLVTIYDLIM